MSASRGSTLLEFALAWPVFLLAALGTVELSVWSVEVLAARSAALAGARAASAAGASSAVGAAIAVRSLQPFLVGTRAVAWCPGVGTQAPTVWVCAGIDRRGADVLIGGVVPALVPLVSGGGLPIRAHVTLPAERFS